MGERMRTALVFASAILAAALATSANTQPNFEDQPEAQEGQANPTEGEDVSEEEDDPAAQIRLLLESLHGTISHLDAVERNRQADHEADHEIRQLHSQENMSFWTMVAASAAAASAAITLAALIALIRTFHQTRRAADYAEKMVSQAERTTDAAYKSLLATENYGRAQLRAYVTLGKVGPHPDTPDGFLSVGIELKNSGQTPAKITSIKRFVGGVSGPVTPDIVSAHLRDETMRPIIGGGESTFISAGDAVNYVEGLRSRVEGGLVTIAMHIQVTYSDIFDNNHQSTFIRVSQKGISMDAGLVMHPDYPDQMT